MKYILPLILIIAMSACNTVQTRRSADAGDRVAENRREQEDLKTIVNDCQEARKMAKNYSGKDIDSLTKRAHYLEIASRLCSDAADQGLSLSHRSQERLEQSAEDTREAEEELIGATKWASISWGIIAGAIFILIVLIVFLVIYVRSRKK